MQAGFSSWEQARKLPPAREWEQSQEARERRGEPFKASGAGQEMGGVGQPQVMVLESPT